MIPDRRCICRMKDNKITQCIKAINELQTKQLRHQGDNQTRERFMNFILNEQRNRDSKTNLHLRL